MSTFHERSRAQAVLSREVGFVRKSHADRVRVALAFPNTYHVGMSNLGFQAAYRLFNDQDAVVCERVFLPEPRERGGEGGRRGPLVTLESQTPVQDFDVLAFSVSFEWDYGNVPALLRRAGLPVFASARGGRHPLVVIGGAVTFLNPEPLAPFADAVACGEGEVLIPALVSAVAGAAGRQDVLERLAATPGLYIPSFYNVARTAVGTLAGHTPRAGTPATVPVRKAVLKTTAGADPPSTAVFTPDTEFGSRLLIEVVRGCANLCRFCWAGYSYLPVRPFPADRILEVARAARAHASRAGLVSIALCDHPEIDEILGGLRALGYSLSPASLRIDDLTPSIVRALVDGGERTMTIAPETGSDRLRRVINKTVTNSEIIGRAEMLFACGIEKLKLYYMIGMPTETDEDLVAIRDLTRQLRDVMMKHARRRGRPGQIIGTVNPMVPKPGTAFQWLPMEQPQMIERRIRRLRALLAGLDNVSLSIKSEKQFFYQALLSLGDRQLAPVIASLEEHRGDWRAALGAHDVEPAPYVFRDRSADAALPWDILCGGPPPAWLRAEYGKSLRAECSCARRMPGADSEGGELSPGDGTGSESAGR